MWKYTATFRYDLVTGLGEKREETCVVNGDSMLDCIELYRVQIRDAIRRGDVVLNSRLVTLKRYNVVL